MPSIKDPTGILSGCGPLILIPLGLIAAFIVICLMSGKKDGPTTGTAAREFRIQQEKEKADLQRWKDNRDGMNRLQAEKQR